MRSSPGPLTRPADRRACSCWTPSRSHDGATCIMPESNGRRAGLLSGLSGHCLTRYHMHRRLLPETQRSLVEDSFAAITLAHGGERRPELVLFRKAHWSGDSASTRMATSCGATIPGISQTVSRRVVGRDFSELSTATHVTERYAT
jgi:hypothetical protein